MKRAFLVMAVLGVVGCGGGNEEPRVTGPTFGTICYGHLCTYPDGDASVTIYTYRGAEVARCRRSEGAAESCWLTRSGVPEDIAPRDLAACHDGPRQPCPTEMP